MSRVPWWFSALLFAWLAHGVGGAMPVAAADRGAGVSASSFVASPARLGPGATRASGTQLQQVATIAGPALKTRQGVPTTMLVPLDTMFVDVTISESAGFRDIQSIEFEMYFQAHIGDGGNPRFDAIFAWQRDRVPAWTVLGPDSTTWRVVPALCSIDSLTNSILPQAVRLAFTPSRVARMSSSGQWNIQVRVNTLSGTDNAKLTNLDVERYLDLVVADAFGDFSAGPAGADSLALVVPADGHLEARVVSNDAYRLRAMTTDLAGLSVPAETLKVGAPTRRMRYFVRLGVSGFVDTDFSDLISPEPGNVEDTPTVFPVFLWLDHPPGQPQQTYGGVFSLRVQTNGGGGGSIERQTPIRATVTSVGLAATSALAEVLPHALSAGGTNQTLTAFLRPDIQPGDTGIDEVLVAMPTGFVLSGVTGARVGGLPVPFADLSTPQELHARLGARLIVSAEIEVSFRVNAPATADTNGVSFAVRFDDSATPAAPQGAVEGDANGQPDGNSLRVQVLPGPLAEVTVTPASATVERGGTRQFTASSRDAYGNPVPASIAWSTIGGVGTVDPTGLFTATAPGSGGVIAADGAVADTSTVVVLVSVVLGGVTAGGTQVAAAITPGSKEGALLSLFLTHDEVSTLRLQSLTLDNATRGPGTLLERDAEFGPLKLYLDDGDGRINPVVDTFLAPAVMKAGQAVFSPLAFDIPVGAIAQLIVGTEASLVARDGDSLDVRITDGSRFVFDRVVPFQNGWPIDPQGSLAVNGMAARQIAVAAGADTTVRSGVQRVLAMEWTVPANGYQADVLEGVRLVNLLDAAATTDISAVGIWRDGGNTIFDAGVGDDALLGNATPGATGWSLAGLSTVVPIPGARLFASVDLAPSAADGRAVRLAIPSAPTGGLTVTSANDGPVDTQVTSGMTITIQGDTAAAVRIVSASQAGRTLLPGAALGPAFRLVLRNDAAVPETLRSIRLTNTSSGPGTQAQLDASWSPLTLTVVEGVLPFSARGSVSAAAVPGPARSASFISGKAIFPKLGSVLPPGATLTLTFNGSASLAARDGDVLDIALTSPTDVDVSPAVPMVGTWPVAPSGAFPVDGMSAAQIAVTPVTTGTFLAGTTHNLVLDAVIPPNGYAPDVLNRLNVTNAGTARSADDITMVEAWVDDGNGIFGPASDRRLGAMAFTGDRWELTGLNETIPLAGFRIFVTCDIAGLANEGRTIRMTLPSEADVAIGVSSGNDGPVDQSVQNPSTQSISTTDRVTLTTNPIAAGVATPGSRDVLTLRILATNTYATPKTLTSLTVTNATTGAGTQGQLDGDLSAVMLRVDGDDDGVLDDVSVDPLVGTGFFSGGRASFAGLSWDLPAGQTRQLFATVDVATRDAADADVIGARVATATDVSFSDLTTVVAGWPLDSGSAWRIDGLVAAQITQLGAPGRTVGAGEGPVPAMDFVVPRNGYLDDVLRGITVRNTGSATSADLAELRLWRDGGDGVFDGGSGDDADLGPLTFGGGVWTSSLLAAQLGSAGARLFVTVRAAEAPTDSVTLQLALPNQGITVDSGNDGPLGAEVTNPNPLLISNALLLTDLIITPGASTIGGTVSARMNARNVGADTIAGIVPSALTASGTGRLVSLTGPVPATLVLPPGATADFTWTYRADSAGTVGLIGGASGVEQGSGQPRQSLHTTSNTHQVYIEAVDVHLFPIESMPFAVNRGQTSVVPLSLTFSNPANPGASSVRLVSLRVRLVDEFGAGIVPASLLSRVVVSEGADVFLDKTALETSGNEIALTLVQPALIPPGGASNQVTLSLSLDISPTTTVPNFRLSIPDSTAFVADDATSGAPVIVRLQTGAYPLRSGLARVGAEATQLDLAARVDSARTFGRGQAGVPLLDLDLLNVDPSGLAADIRISAFQVTLVDSSGTPLADPRQVLSRIRVRGPVQTHLDRALNDGDGATFRLSLSALVSAPANTPLVLRIEGDIAAAATLGAFRLRLDDSSSFDARDANTSAPVAVRYAANPVEGARRIIQSPTDSIVVRRISGIAPEVTVGQTGVTAMVIRLAHTGGPQSGAVRLDRITLRTRDQLENPVVPGAFVDRVALQVGGQPVGEVNNPPGSGSRVSVPLAGVLLAPGDSLDLELVVDVESTAPESFFQMQMGATDLEAVDANLGTLVTPRASPGASLPVGTGVTRIQPPARELIVQFTDRMPVMVAGGGSGTAFARLRLTNTAGPGSGGIRVGHLAIRAGDRDAVPILAGEVATRIEAWNAGTLWAQSGPLQPTDGVAMLVPVDTLEVSPGSPVELELRMAARSPATRPALRLGLEAADIGVVQPASALLTVAVRPSAGQSFPFWTQPASLGATSLGDSYSNFPNPFAAGRDQTTFVFYLKTDARVTLRLWTGRGEIVRTLLENAPRAAGLHQDVAWDGLNGARQPVYNGAYLSEIVVRFADGSSERHVRKVAVVR